MHAKLDGPAGEFSEIDIHEARSKLLGLKPVERFAAVRRSVKRGSDLLVATLTRSDPFLVEGALSDGERAAILDLWRKSKHPEDYARLTRLEADAELVNNTSKILTAYQKACANQAIVSSAGALPPVMNPRGAPEPTPMDRGFHSMSLVDRARATTKMIAAALGSLVFCTSCC